MSEFSAILKKEFLQLIRDLPGLSVLFLMPAILLIVISTTQENIMLSRNSGIRVVIVNEDNSTLGDSIVSGFKNSPFFRLSFKNSANEAEQAISEGSFELGVMIPAHATENLALMAKKSLNPGNTAASSPDMQKSTGIEVIFDPAIQKIYKNLAVSSLQQIIQKSSMAVFMKYYTSGLKLNLESQFSDYIKSVSKFDFEKGIPEFPHRTEVISRFRAGLEKKLQEPVKLDLPENMPGQEGIIALNERVAKNNRQLLRPGFLQNNIPAFTLFAMFFIVIPLAGSIINEKQQGTRDRLRTLAVSYTLFFSAKVVLYLAVCIVQFVFMMAIGQYLLPQLCSLKPLDLHVNAAALSLVLISSGLAATGFGILIGIFAGTHGQAATFGSVLVVILAMLGGIFVPAYMMPDSIRAISHLSPLRWGTDAFLAVFGRQTGIRAILPEIFSLFGFFSIALIVAVRVFNRRK